MATSLTVEYKQKLKILSFLFIVLQGNHSSLDVFPFLFVDFINKQKFPLSFTLYNNKEKLFAIVHI